MAARVGGVTQTQCGVRGAGVQSRAGQDGAPLTTESLMAERDRLVDSLAHLDVQIAGARGDLQRLARSDEQELCESRLIILQVPAPSLQEPLGSHQPRTARPAGRASSAPGTVSSATSGML